MLYPFVEVNLHQNLCLGHQNGQHGAIVSYLENHPIYLEDITENVNDLLQNRFNRSLIFFLGVMSGSHVGYRVPETCTVSPTA